MNEVHYHPRRSRVFFAGVAVSAIAVMLVIKNSAGTSESENVTPLPLVLKQVQSLGELHTTKFNYENVYEFKTSRQPEEWTNYLPGLSNLVESSTTNHALMSANGSVEAGVDLSKAQVLSEGLKTVVVLPQPKVYEPVVDAKLHKFQTGFFWADTNIALKGRRDAARRMKLASLDQGILDKARASATERIEALVKPLVQGELEVRFQTF